MKRKYIITLILVFTVVGLLHYTVEHILPYSPIKPHLIKNNQLREKFGEKLAEVKRIFFVQKFTTQCPDSTLLQCLYIKPNSVGKTKGTIILLHGIADRKESMLHLGTTLLKDNFSVILFDQRAHGESGGNYCTFGYYEKHDVSNIITTALLQFRDLGPIGVFGNSLGAAVSLQAMEIDKRIKCGVVESSFANLRETIYDYMQRLVFIRIEWVADYALKKSEHIAKFEVDSVRPEFSARNIFVPVLVIHGEQDKNIPINHGKRIFANIISPQKEFYTVPDAGHYDVDKIGGEQLNRKIIYFYETYLN